MNKYMKLIEEITCVNWYEDNKTKAKLFNDIYKIAHIANWTCENEHKGRRKYVDNLIKEYE